MKERRNQEKERDTIVNQDQGARKEIIRIKSRKNTRDQDQGQDVRLILNSAKIQIFYYFLDLTLRH